MIENYMILQHQMEWLPHLLPSRRSGSRWCLHQCEVFGLHSTVVKPETCLEHVRLVTSLMTSKSRLFYLVKWFCDVISDINKFTNEQIKKKKHGMHSLYYYIHLWSSRNLGSGCKPPCLTQRASYTSSGVGMLIGELRGVGIHET